MLECDETRVHEQILKAESALQQRLKALSEIFAGGSEREEIAVALNCSLALQTCALFPAILQGIRASSKYIVR
jgi:hypothetical protein